jgi:hypothetical protein
MNEKSKENSWVICPECKIKLKQNNISTHMQHVHNKVLDESSETVIQAKIPKKRKNQKPIKKISKVKIGLIIIIIVIVTFSIYVYSTTNPKESNNNNNNNSNVPAWMKNYTPINNLGTGTTNFWINFPVGNPSVGQSVQHKTWITETLEEKPVVFVCHRTGCGPCTPQADRVKALIKTYGEDIVFYDLDNPFEGYGTMKEGVLEKYNEAFDYDPNGGSHYIALTGVFTHIKDGGEVKIGWHSWEGNVDDAAMENWIKDAIYYYHINSRG